MFKTRLATLAALIALVAAGASISRAEQGLLTHKALSLDMAMAMARDGCECPLDELQMRHRGARRHGPNHHRDAGRWRHAAPLRCSAQEGLYGAALSTPSKDVVEGWSKKTAGSIPLAEGTMPSPPIEGTIAMGGGLPIKIGNDVIGAIAVSGAPGWPMDKVAKPAWTRSPTN